ncbi:MAG: pentapeptide repeat-containing protein [Lutispora sp.]
MNTGHANTGFGNSGYFNSGEFNSGDHNSGSHNSGDGNSGDWNSGDWNSGDCNSGDWNSGSRNSGHYNSGWHNSGKWNSGDWNSGDWNVTDGNSGCFCTETHTIKFFDRDSNWTLEDWRTSDAYRLLCFSPLAPVTWIDDSNMTKAEKAKHQEYKTTGGYLKRLTPKERAKVAQKWWDSLNADEKQIIKNIPNFDPIKFKQITGIEVD